ncbi:Nodulation protein D 2 [Pseudomonas frederiksbergensis]|uniref:Nodulation protein D 2 n=2 Tax=Pseudomonas frederiksbergensis TaxID=104087 RepID=A0A6L5C3B6_9PSED|nr:Nodulation protein D 2 [Pseudomonas frederiksbergensis]
MKFDERLFLDIDLNSLLTLLVVYREQGVTKAAGRLEVHQPAVSNTLAKLRCYFCDPLFTRHCRTLLPTPKATEIVKRLEPALLEIQKVLMAAAN